MVNLIGLDFYIEVLEAANKLSTDKNILQNPGKLLLKTKDMVDGLLNSIHGIADVREISRPGTLIAGEIITMYQWADVLSKLSQMFL